MDNIQREYQEAYRNANGEDIRVRRITTVRYIIQGTITEFTAKQMRGFTNGLEKRAVNREVE